MTREHTRPVQVRLPDSVDDFLTEVAREREESKTQIVVEALECLRQQLLERRMEVGYRELAEGKGGEAGEQAELVRAGLSVTLPTIPD